MSTNAAHSEHHHQNQNTESILDDKKAPGDVPPGRPFTFDGPDITAVRKRLKLSQDKFAKKFGRPAATVWDWEQGRRQRDASC